MIKINPAFHISEKVFLQTSNELFIVVNYVIDDSLKVYYTISNGEKQLTVSDFEISTEKNGELI